MKTAFISTITIGATASLLSGSLAAQVFDAPGPGYREQAERFSPKKAPVDLDLIISTSAVFQRTRTDVDPTNVLESSVPATSKPFSEPIRLFDTAAGTRAVLPVKRAKGQK